MANTETTYVHSDERVIDFDDALARAWAKIRRAAKDGTDINKRRADGSARRYTTLAAVDEAIRDALTAEGFTYPQPPSTRTDERGVWIVIHTQIRRKGVAFVPEPFALLAQGGIMKGGEGFKPATAQDQGSALTYARRYALTSIFGVCPDEDDDGHKASQRPEPEPDRLWQSYLDARAAAAKHLRVTEQQAHQRLLALAEVREDPGMPDADVHKLVSVAQAMLLTDPNPTPREPLTPGPDRERAAVKGEQTVPAKAKPSAAKATASKTDPAPAKVEPAVVAARKRMTSAAKAYAEECETAKVKPTPWTAIATKGIGRPWVESEAHTADEWDEAAGAFEAEIETLRGGQ